MSTKLHRDIAITEPTIDDRFGLRVRVSDVIEVSCGVSQGIIAAGCNVYINENTHKCTSSLSGRLIDDFRAAGRA